MANPRPLLSIDLNEAPQSPPAADQVPPSAAAADDALAVVLQYHGQLARAPGVAAEFPGAAGGGSNRCGICMGWESVGETVVCDGCEVGYHVECLAAQGLPMRLVGGNWTCRACEMCGPTQKRWVLGPIKLLDINELPSPGDEEGAAIGIGRMSNPVETSSNGGISYPKIVQIANASGLGNHTSTVSNTIQTAGEAAPYQRQNASKDFNKLVFGSSSSVIRPREDIYLNALRDFISEKGGFIGEGWHVEFMQPRYPYGPDPCPLYCAPDGKKFDSMHDVAESLGISSVYTPIGLDERSNRCGSMKRLLPSRRRKKDLARSAAPRKFTENLDIASINPGEELSSMEVMPQCTDVESASIFTNSSTEENCDDGSLQLSVGLPIQYEDFFVLCLGKVDARAAYHDSCHIWPIGYRSNWHDKVTGSLFQCEVADGGDSGPSFKIRRRPCSLYPILDGATILLCNKATKVDPRERVESSSKMIFDGCPIEEENILMLLSEPNPSEQDLSSCLGHADTQLDIGKPDPLNKSSSLKDAIGEFYVEGRSSSSAWEKVSQTLIHHCREAYRRLGCLQFCCQHACGSFVSVGKTVKNAQYRGLARFCYASRPLNIPLVIKSNSELEDSCRSLTEWVEQDRFGLDIGFVQEIIETLPASRACSRYQFLSERNDFSLSCTVGSGLLFAMKKNGQGCDEDVSYGLYSGKNGYELQDIPAETPLADQPPPLGQPLSSKLPAELVGDIFQISEFLWRFYEILGLKEPLSFDDLEEELINPWPCDLSLGKTEKENQDSRDKAPLANEILNTTVPLSTGISVSESIEKVHDPFRLIPVETAATREAAQVEVASCTCSRCCGEALTKVHVALLKLLVGELLRKMAVFLDPKFDCRESKPRRGRKREMENYSTKETKIELLTVNEVTWPELARRYILVVLLLKGRMDSHDICSRESQKVFRCLQGDGGVLCGGLSGIAGMEADALLLTEAERQISYSTKQEDDVLSVDYTDSDARSACVPATDAGNMLPEWAQPLEPVRKLPTNVGTRIRRCVYSSLEKSPPDWAKKILEHSISKEVYKGNASGPTKKAVLSILAKLTSSTQQQKPERALKARRPLKLSDFIMTKCRAVLRSVLSADESKTFCNLLGTGLLNSNDYTEKGILGSPAMVSRPLDFRTIDLRLAVGAYGGSHDTFLEDVREVWHNLCTAYGDQSDLMQKLETLSQNFESLYEKEVLHLKTFIQQSRTVPLDAEKKKELNDILRYESELPKAPWEHGVCKVCGIDKDDVSVLLCDKCDSEYHRYCLNPPLARIPDGDWFCPSCVANQHNVKGKSTRTQAVANHPRGHPKDGRVFQDILHQLATSMGGQEYWELHMKERVFLLKFLCDEVLNTAVFREHIEQSLDKSNHAQQKLYALAIDWRNLKMKEELLAKKTGKEHSTRSMGTGDFVREETGTMHFINKVTYPTKFSASPLKKSSSSLAACSEENRQTYVNQNSDQLLKSMIEKHANGSIPQTLSDEINAASGTHIGNGHVAQGDELNRHKHSPDIQDVLSTQRNGVVLSSAVTCHGSQQTSVFEANSVEVNSLRNEILELQDSIVKIETQVMLMSLRRNFLGRDSVGRSYWVISRPGKCPWYVVDGSTCDLASISSILGTNDYPSCSRPDSNLNPLVLYESDTEIQQLVRWLGDGDSSEREVKECILQWQRLASYQESIFKSDPRSSVVETIGASHCLLTKANAVLKNRYGPCLEEEVCETPKKRGKKEKVTTEERMYRCDCLELVWPSRYHCLSCHRTFCSVKDLEGHNDGKCSRADECKESDEQMKGKVCTKGKENFGDVDTVKFSRRVCPYDLEEISKKFITNDSNRELVQEIGLIGSHGIPYLISSPPASFDPPLILNGRRTTNDQQSISAQSDGSNASPGVMGNKGEQLLKPCAESRAVGEHASTKIKGLKVIQTCRISEPSLRPLFGKASHIIKRLKINLLDMEAALPEEALRPSKNHSLRRCAWRAFVKSAESIFEMVQASVLLEDMIKADYLKTGWWYWSSLTAAAKTSTVSALALRIFTLDDSIIYVREDPQTPSSLDPLEESSRLINNTSGKKRKDMNDAGPS